MLLILHSLKIKLEFLNGKFDPFAIKLDGWSESMNEGINDYLFYRLKDYQIHKQKNPYASTVPSPEMSQCFLPLLLPVSFPFFEYSSF